MLTCLLYEFSLQIERLKQIEKKYSRLGLERYVMRKNDTSNCLHFLQCTVIRKEGMVRYVKDYKCEQETRSWKIIVML